jgi:hypothetical protein
LGSKLCEKWQALPGTQITGVKKAALVAKGGLSE